MATKKTTTGTKKRVGASQGDVEQVAEPRTKPRYAQLKAPQASEAQDPSTPQPPKAKPAQLDVEDPVYESLKRPTDARDLEKAIAGGYQSLRGYIQLRAARGINLVFEATEVGLQSGALSSGTVGGAKLILEQAMTDPVDVHLGKGGDTKRKLVDRVQALSAIEAQLGREAAH